MSAASKIATSSSSVTVMALILPRPSDKTSRGRTTRHGNQKPTVKRCPRTQQLPPSGKDRISAAKRGCVARGGVEPPTFRFSGGRSDQLSYLAGGGWMCCRPCGGGDPDGTRTRDL